MEFSVPRAIAPVGAARKMTSGRQDMESYVRTGMHPALLAVETLECMGKRDRIDALLPACDAVPLPGSAEGAAAAYSPLSSEPIQ
jgi:hypothetical protein